MLTPKQIIRAWKDAEYRESLNHEERAQLPENPVGLIEVTADELGDVAGGQFDRHPAEEVLRGINHPVFNCDLTEASGVTCNSTGCGCINLADRLATVSQPLKIFSGR